MFNVQYEVPYNWRTFKVFDLPPTTYILGWEQNPNYVKSTLDYPNNMYQNACLLSAIQMLRIH